MGGPCRNRYTDFSGGEADPARPEYVVEGYGDLGASSQASLVCRYFNGRRVLSTVFWHAPNNFMGRDSCPVISRGW